MAKKKKPLSVGEERLDPVQEPNSVKARDKPGIFQRFFPSRGGKPVIVDPTKVEATSEVEERRATDSGPQLFSLVVDHSASMEQGSKAEEATRVLREVIDYAREVNSSDQAGKKTYFCIQVVLFADKIEDSTGGMKRPPADPLPVHAFTVRHRDCPERLGNLTNYQAPLQHVRKTLTGQEGMTNARQKAAMPAPIVLFISDGKPNHRDGNAKARKLAIQEAGKIKSLALPAATRLHPVHEELSYSPTNVRLVTIGLGNGEELDQGLLRDMCTQSRFQGEDISLYLHCPNTKDLHKIGTQIVGTITKADEKGETLEKVIYDLQQAKGG